MMQTVIQPGPEMRKNTFLCTLWYAISLFTLLDDHFK